MSKSSTPKVAAKKARGAHGVRSKTVAKAHRERSHTAPTIRPRNPKVVSEKARVPRKAALEKATDDAPHTNRRMAAHVEAIRDGQVPGTMNAIAECSVAQTREVYERSKHTLQAVLASWERSVDQSTMALNRRLFDVADRNINDALILQLTLPQRRTLLT